MNELGGLLFLKILLILLLLTAIFIITLTLDGARTAAAT